jgi:omega-6 fatty acid desaturase (delta-12 desaturase)
MAVRSRSTRPGGASTDAPVKPAKASTSTVGPRPLTTGAFASRQPAAGPAPFSLDDIKRAIPQHCFERPLYKSFGYLFYDLAVIAVVMFASLFIKQAAIKAASLFSVIFGLSQAPLASLVADSALAASAATAAAGSAYAALPFAMPATGVLSFFGEAATALFAQPVAAALSSPQLAVYCLVLTGLWVATILLQGAVMTGVWVIGHECGHGGFSDNKLIGDAVGLVFHTILFVPYHSWAISHRTHHSHNADMELDEVHLPVHANTYMPSAAHGYLHNAAYTEDAEQARQRFVPSTLAFLKEVNRTLIEFNFIHRAIATFFTYGMGWFLYMFFNSSGRRYEKTSIFPVNHFMPSSPIFKKNEATLVAISTGAMIAWIICLYRIVQVSSLATVTAHFFFPYLIVQFWLIAITLLQHTHTALPRYSSASWDYVRGALATVDRDYGAFLNWTLHNINDTHVVHHLFSYMPHYHAMEATEAVREMLGEWYVRSEATAGPFGILREIWTTARECNFIAEDGHPALLVAEEAIRSQRAGKDEKEVAAAVEAVKEEAYAAGPHANGRNTAKEVYWFRTVHTE